MIGKRAPGKTCEAIDGILEEGEEVMEDFDETEALDPGRPRGRSGGRALRDLPLRHPEAWAQELGLKDAVSSSTRPFRKRRRPTQLLTKLAESRVNQKAA